MNEMKTITRITGLVFQVPFSRCCSIALAAITAAGLGAASYRVYCNAADSYTLKMRFQQELNTLYAQYRFPGATAAYILPDGTVEVFAVGMADRELMVPMTTDSRMLAASIGKTFVGAAVLALAQEGVLGLDDLLSKWLGDRAWFSRLPNGNSVTLRQLLVHSSGIPNHVETERFKELFRNNRDHGSAPLSPEELISCVLGLRPLCRPGMGWHYSDTGYILLGLVVEKAAGHRYYDEIGRRFLRPLGLTMTSASDSRELPGLAAGYLSGDNIFGLPCKTTLRPGFMAWHPGVEWTGGGVVSNPKDLVVWAKALYEGHAMKGCYLPALLKSVPAGKTGTGKRYGIAVAVHDGGPFGTSYGHSGWIPGYTSGMRYYPGPRVAVAFQINTDIGIVDGSTRLFQEMEERLAKAVMDSIGDTRTGNEHNNECNNTTMN